MAAKSNIDRREEYPAAPPLGLAQVLPRRRTHEINRRCNLLEMRRQLGHDRSTSLYESPRTARTPLQASRVSESAGERTGVIGVQRGHCRDEVKATIRDWVAQHILFEKLDVLLHTIFRPALEITSPSTSIPITSWQRCASRRASVLGHIRHRERIDNPAAPTSVRDRDNECYDSRHQKPLPAHYRPQP